MRTRPARKPAAGPAGEDEDEKLVRIPFSQAVVRGAELHRELRDPALEPSRTRIVPLDGEAPKFGEDLVSMGEMIVRADGGSLRTFSGNLPHENGWWPSRKRRRLQHWQGEAQRFAMLKAECDFGVNWAQTEARRFRFNLDGWREYTCDLEIDRFDAPVEIVEIKRDDRALEDPDYRLTLAAVDEICRRCGMTFRIVLEDEIFASRHHRDNVELFASRRFIDIDRDHYRRLEALAATDGPVTTYGEVSRALEPAWVSRGRAIAQGLLVQRRIEIDLTGRLHDRVPVIIH